MPVWLKEFQDSQGYIVTTTTTSMVEAEAAAATTAVPQTTKILSGFGGYTSNTRTCDVNEVGRNRSFKARISPYTERVSGQPKLHENQLQNNYTVIHESCYAFSR